MSSVKDLPKIEQGLKGEIMSPHKLKETQVKEKFLTFSYMRTCSHCRKFKFATLRKFTFSMQFLFFAFFQIIKYGKKTEKIAKWCVGVTRICTV